MCSDCDLGLRFSQTSQVIRSSETALAPGSLSKNPNTGLNAQHDLPQVFLKAHRFLFVASSAPPPPVSLASLGTRSFLNSAQPLLSQCFVLELFKRRA